VPFCFNIVILEVFWKMQTIIKTKVNQGGRIVIPAEMRKYLGIEIGEEVNLTLEQDSMRISTGKLALKRIRQTAQTIEKQRDSIVDELIADRRKEADNE
jgi:AbrB family looped-hinge helix DNA binding protein